MCKESAVQYSMDGIMCLSDPVADGEGTSDTE
jgi:hypothetical protein